MRASRPIADLSHVENWIFDLDNTLYPQANNLFALVEERMTEFVALRLGLSRESAFKLQKDYFHSHGTTLSGLIAVHGIEPADFLDYVHAIDLSRLAPDRSLAAAIARLPGRKLVYTNGPEPHARRVLEKLGISDHFEAIHDIVAAGFEPKPYRPAYEAMLRHHSIAPMRAAMFEDVARNLEVPHALGMTTVLVCDEAPEQSHVDHTTDNLAEFLATARIMSYEQRAAPGAGEDKK